MEERRALEESTAARRIGADPRVSPFVLHAVDQLVDAMLAEPATDDITAPVFELALDDLSVSRYLLVPDSECEVCAAPVLDSADGAVVTLTPRAKPTPTSYRLSAAAELDLPVSAYANPTCGALTPRAFPAYQCSATLPVSGFFRVRSKYDYHEMWWSGQAQSYASSERYGMLEGLERYAGQFPRAKRTVVHDSHRHLGADALDPRELGSYPTGFYAGHDAFYAPFDPDRELPWVWGYSLRDDRPVLVPEQIVYYLDRSPDRKFVQECSNGCASGSCTEEALLHGMLELIERDAFLLCWHGNARMPEIDPASCQDLQTRLILDRVGRLGYRMRFFDMRIDLPVPAVMAVAQRRDGGPGTLCFAAGASFDPEEAVRSALAETASYIPGLDDRVLAREPALRAMVSDYDRVHELSDHPLLWGLPEMASRVEILARPSSPRPLAELYRGWLAERPATLDLVDDVRYLAGAICAVGGDLVAVDQTCPEQRPVGVRTWAMIASGLVPIDFGWERQRVLTHPRLRDYLAGRLRLVPRGDGFGPTGLNARPHPFP